MNTQLAGPKHARADVGRAHRGRSLLAAAAASFLALTGLSGIALASDEDETTNPSTSTSSLQTNATEGAPPDETQPTGDAGTISSGTAGGSSAAPEESATAGTPAATADTDVPAAPEPTATTPSKAPTSIQTRDVQVQPLAAGPEATSSPFIYWEARSTAAGNALVSGAIFEVQGPRTSGNGDDNDSRWSSNTITVEDNVGQNGYSGADLDPDPGEFQVQKIGSHTVSARNRYRIQKVAAPYGYGIGTVSWVMTPAAPTNSTTPASGAWTGTPLRWEPADFTFAPLSRSHTITVNKGDLRSDVTDGTSSVSISSTYTQGARFALYQTSTSTTVLSQCTTDASGKCVFSNVNAVGVLWVGELDPLAGSTAAGQYSAPLGTFTTGQGTTNDPFVDRPYRYATSSLSSSTNQSITVPSTPSSTNSWDQSSGRYVNRLANPKLTQKCAAGVRVAVVMDLSGSVNGYQDNLAQATTQLVDGLTGTPSSMALFSFSTESPATKWDNGNTSTVLLLNHPALQSVQTAADANIVKSWYSSDSNGQTANFTPSGGTNWDLGLWQAAQGSTGANHYDVVFVLTDGNPTFSGTNTRAGSGSLTTFRELERAVASSNVLKKAGSRVITVGIGAGLSDYNLSAISGTAKYTTGAGINDFDYVSSDWNQLKQVMSAFAQGLKCQATVTVEKQAQPYGGSLAAASGWNFGLSQTGAAQQTPSGASQATGSNGQATWTLTFARPTDEASVTLTELEDRTGWSLTGITCDVGGVAVDLANKKVGLSGIGIGENVKCTFTNVESQVGALAITKKFDNSVPTGTSGSFGGNYTCTLKGATVASGTWSTQGQGDATLTAAQDSPAPPTKIPAGASCSVTETAASGGFPDGSWVWGTATITGPVKIESGATSTVTVTNTTNRVLGSVTWRKADQSNNPLAGSGWTLTGPDTPSGGTPVTDCTGLPCGNGLFDDQDPAVGGFRLTGLSWGDYTLVESKAPVGYVLDPTEHKFAIGQTLPAMLDNDLGAIQNVPVTTPNLPLTGGLGTDTFLLAGGGLLALAGIGGWIHRRRSLRVQRA